MAVGFRYPGLYIELESDEYKEAFVAAKKILDFVVSHLPENCRVLRSDIVPR